MLHASDENLQPKIRRKLVIVGDGSCGKTSLLMVQAGQPFPEEYIPTIFENYVSKIQIGNKVIDMGLWDTAGQEDYDRLRPLSYPDTDVVIMTYNIMDRESFDNVKDKWIPEVSHFCQKIPILLVANKKDLRDDAEMVEELRRKGTKPVTEEQGKALAAEIGANKYFETSAKTTENVKELFQVAAKLSLKQKGKGNKLQNNCKML